MKYKKTNKKDTCIMCGKPTDAKIPLCCFKCLTEWMNEQYGDNKPNKQIDNVGWKTNL